MLAMRGCIEQQLYFSINQIQAKFYWFGFGENALEGLIFPLPMLPECSAETLNRHEAFKRRVGSLLLDHHFKEFPSILK